MNACSLIPSTMIGETPIMAEAAMLVLDGFDGFKTWPASAGGTRPKWEESGEVTRNSVRRRVGD